MRYMMFLYDDDDDLLYTNIYSECYPRMCFKYTLYKHTIVC